MKGIRHAARRPVMLVILDGLGWREERGRQRRPPGQDADLRPAVAGLPARLPAHLRPRCRPAGRADGQFRSRPPEYRRRPRGDAGTAAHRRRDRGRQIASARRRSLDLIAKLKASGGTCHLLGLVSPGGVHSHQDHAAALAKILARRRRADAASTPSPTAATRRRNRRPTTSTRLHRGAAADVRDRHRHAAATTRWTATSAGTASRRPMARSSRPKAPRFADAPAVDRRRLCQQEIRRVHRARGDRRLRGMKDGDGVLCFNFRADRVREILAALLDPDFDGFPRKRVVRFAAAVGMTHYSDELDTFMPTFFPPQTLGAHPRRGGGRRRPQAAAHGGDREISPTSPTS